MNSPNHNHDSLDEQIDLALGSFNGAMPPDGMHARVLRSARLTAITRSGLLNGSVRSWLILGTACAAAAFGLFFTTGSSKHTLTLQAPPTYVVETALPPPDIPQRAERATPHAIPNASSKAHVSWAKGNAEPENELGQRQSSVAAVDATNAPSQQAPALPLTRQETLLLAAARGQASLTQIAKLRRPVWPLRDPADDEDFRKFFDPQTPLATDGDNE